MHLVRRTRRDVLRDKRGISASLPEALAGAGLKAIIIAAVGGVIATGFAFWAVSTASADTSSGFQNANVAFEKAVHEADVVVGTDDSRVGLLRDLPDDKCEVQTWQGMDRDGAIGLQVDIKTVDGICTPTTPLLEAGSAKDSKELLFNIEEPVFTYANLGGRELAFNASGVATLTTGAKPEGTKKSNWEDVRPYKVTMTLQSLSEDTAAAAKKSVSTGYTNVVAVTAAADGLRYVPAPSSDPIPGPLDITSVVRSETTGTAYAGAREGIVVTFTGGVCESGPTKVVVSYTQQSPSAASPVNTVRNGVLTGSQQKIHLGSVPNGSTGVVEATATCIDEGVVVKDSMGFTQRVPATVLTVKQSSVGNHVHNLSWVKVSSLPTLFTVAWKIGSTEFTKGTDQLAYAATNKVGSTLGVPIEYGVTAVVDRNMSPEAQASITTPLPKPPPTEVGAGPTGVGWQAVTCTPGSTAEYAARYYQQVGTSTAVNWGALTAWGTARQLKDVTTPGYGRSVYEVHSRCVSTESGAKSDVSVSDTDAFYEPEAVKVSAARSTTAGTLYSGAREGVVGMYSGGRCYGNTPTTITATWNGQSPNRFDVKVEAGTKVLTGAAQSVHVAGVPNGSLGSLLINSRCTAGTTGIGVARASYAQPVPAPVLSVKQGASVNQHVVSWTAVSSLPTTFKVSKTAQKGTENNSPAPTTALTQTFNYLAGTNYGNKTDYRVTATVESTAKMSLLESITGTWPATPTASTIAWKHTGSSRADSKGTVSWAFSGSCPAGTTLQSRLNENRSGKSDGKYDTAVKKTTAWGNGTRSYAWDPSYALQGYSYGVNVQVQCASNVTGLTSTITSAQSPYFTTPMAQPAAPVWYAYNYKDYIRGTNWTWSTCYYGNEMPNCPTMTVDYRTFCPSGSWVGWSNFTSITRYGAMYNHAFGWRDYWLLGGSTPMDVTYTNARYQCFTPWVDNAGADTPQNPRTLTSPAGANKVVTVRPYK